MRELVERDRLPCPSAASLETHTGHPFGPEGYKTIAYELYRQLGDRLPAAVFIPTAYAELLYGVWLGFKELSQSAGAAPRRNCSPVSRRRARRCARRWRRGGRWPRWKKHPRQPIASSSAANGYRGVLAVRESEGDAVAVSDDDMLAAQTALGREGLWAELSGAAGLAGLRQAARAMSFDGPVVCLMTSSGLKDQGLPARNPAARRPHLGGRSTNP
jgi:threonine synthase